MSVFLLLSIAFLSLPETALAQTNVVTGDGVLTITLNAQPGAPLDTIYQNLQTSFGVDDRPDVLVIQGGVNDVFWWGWNLVLMENNYSSALTHCIEYAKSRGVPRIYVLELTPVIPEIVDNYSDYTRQVAPVQPKIELLNGVLRVQAANQGFTAIHVYDWFKPHWVAAFASWCLWEGSDSVHPSAAGNRELGRSIADAIRADAPPGLPVRITLAGDSILAATGWPDHLKPSTFVRYYLTHPPSSARGWRDYQ